MLLGASREECAGDGWDGYSCVSMGEKGVVILWLIAYGFFPLLLQCRTPYAVIHDLVLPVMGIMMPETC